MGKIRILYVDVLLMVFLSCGLVSVNHGEPAEVYHCELPPLPESWFTLLGSPAWRIEWTTSDGSRNTLEVPPSVSQAAVPLDGHQPGPIWAWPYWPQLGIGPYRTKPAGALIPLDLQDDHCKLSWLGGVEATLFYYLQASSGNSKYRAEYFNWPRFRSLFSEAKLPPPVLADPWCVDWVLLAEKPRVSGFDSRRLVPRAVRSLVISLPAAGPWVSGSPFTPVLAGYDAQETGNVTVNASSSVDTILSTHGIISYSWDGIAYIPGLEDP